jgi:hypothetical protein
MYCDFVIADIVGTLTFFPDTGVLRITDTTGIRIRETHWATSWHIGTGPVRVSPRRLMMSTMRARQRRMPPRLRFNCPKLTAQQATPQTRAAA